MSPLKRNISCVWGVCQGVWQHQRGVTLIVTVRKICVPHLLSSWMIGTLSCEGSNCIVPLEGEKSIKADDLFLFSSVLPLHQERSYFSKDRKVWASIHDAVVTMATVRKGRHGILSGALFNWQSLLRGSVSGWFIMRTLDHTPFEDSPPQRIPRGGTLVAGCNLDPLAALDTAMRHH